MSKNDLYPEIFEALGYVKTDALSNLEAKRGCQWANELIVKAAEAVERFEQVKMFYFGKKQIRPRELLSVTLQGDDSYLKWWTDFCGSCETDTAIPDEDECEAVNLGLAILSQAINSIPGLSSRPYFFDDGSAFCAAVDSLYLGESESKRKDLKRTVQDYTLAVAEACYRLSICEWTIKMAHPNWPLDWVDDAVCDISTGRKAIANLAVALQKYDCEHPDLFDQLREALHGLLNLSDVLPVAFVMKESPTMPSYDFTAAVRNVLMTPPEVEFVISGDNVGTYTPSKLYQNARDVFLRDIYETIRKRAKTAESETVHRLWLEVASELLANTSQRQPAYSPEAAERIIELANRAQRESWIERMMKGDRPAPAEFKRTLDAEPTKQPDHTPAAKDDLEERVERILARYGIKAKAKRKETGSSTAVELGKYAAEFVTLCDPKKGLLVLNGNVTFNIPPTSKQVWKVVKKLVQSKDPDGWTKLPPKWKSSFHRKDKLGKPAADSSHEQLLKLIKPQDLHPGCKGTKHHLIPPSA